MDKYYWTLEDFENLKKAETMAELLNIALAILDRMPKPVSLVSGPISTGGRGSTSQNLKVFAEAIEALAKTGETVFNQLPFEDKFSELSRRSKLSYFMLVLDDFFLPILKSGKIDKIWFMPGWETSTGAKWEYEQAKKLAIEHDFLDSTDIG
ncbi:MAG: DUF4406 domain-containing protein [bacterium]|nr:DUF4406 domain-containing protein [bacterium]